MSDKKEEDRRRKEEGIREPAQAFEDLIVWQKAHAEARYYLRLARDLGYPVNPVLSEDALEI